MSLVLRKNGLTEVYSDFELAENFNFRQPEKVKDGSSNAEQSDS